MGRFVSPFLLLSSALKFWLLFENNYSPSSLKHSLPQPPHTDWNGEWWQRQAATSSRLVFHWSNCINQSCLQRVHIVQWWMTAGNYATAQKHHTSHLWCADTAVESDPGLTHSRKKEKNISGRHLLSFRLVCLWKVERGEKKIWARSGLE